MPERIQLSRKKGWRKPEGAVVVARPSKWGNPFRVIFHEGRWLVLDDNGVDYEPWANTRLDATRKAVELFEADGFYWFGGRLDALDVVRELRGKDLACWCKIGDPCHADVLLELANGDEAQP